MNKDPESAGKEWCPQCGGYRYFIDSNQPEYIFCGCGYKRKRQSKHLARGIARQRIISREEAEKEYPK